MNTNVNINARTTILKSLLSYETVSESSESGIEIIPQTFTQEKGIDNISSLQKAIPSTDFCSIGDDVIRENKQFSYLIFNPLGKSESHKAILLLHGLNERSWDKYLTWAEDLAMRCSVPVILFPIAFHINRTPQTWFTPRWIMPYVSKRKEEIEGLSNSSFFNLALSSRLSKSPSRFYISGRESIYNIWQLFLEIKDGKHPVFSKDCKLDIFAYSIGALLSQVLLIANPDNLFSDSKLMTFCGGSIFEDMDGNAKDIMDKSAFDSIRNYYINDFLKTTICGDAIENAFKMMISTRHLQSERENFFTKSKSRIKMILMKKDRVIPTAGAINAVGEQNKEIVEELDFPFEYNHQIPFPASNKISPEELFLNFRSIFDRAESFLCV